MTGDTIALLALGVAAFILIILLGMWGESSAKNEDRMQLLDSFIARKHYYWTGPGKYDSDKWERLAVIDTEERRRLGYGPCDHSHNWEGSDHCIDCGAMPTVETRHE